MTVDQLLDYIKNGTDDRLYAISQLMWLGVDQARICDVTQIDMFFLDKIRKIVDFERELEQNVASLPHLREAKRLGFSDSYVAELWHWSEDGVYALRCRAEIFPVYKMIDTCASEFDSYVPYFYSTYAEENESVVTERKRSLSSAPAPSASGRVSSSTIRLSTPCGRSGSSALRPSS